MKGSSGALLSWLTGEQYDIFIRSQDIILEGGIEKEFDQILSYNGQKFGMRYYPHIFSHCSSLQSQYS